MPKKKRCGVKTCKTKLSTVQQITGKCKCGIVCCGIHKHDHNCSFEHSTEAAKNLDARFGESVQFAKLDKL